MVYRGVEGAGCGVWRAAERGEERGGEGRRDCLPPQLHAGGSKTYGQLDLRVKNLKKESSVFRYVL